MPEKRWYNENSVAQCATVALVEARSCLESTNRVPEKAASGTVLSHMNLRPAAEPYLNALAELTQETVNISVLDGDECVNIGGIASPKPTQYVGWLGRRTPLHCRRQSPRGLPHTWATALPSCQRRCPVLPNGQRQLDS
ncbi:MAG: hypothetical protein ACE5LU_20935 [Anaerolineae bacterium]